MVDPHLDGAGGESRLELNGDRTMSYRSRAAATLRDACERSGRNLGELAAILSDRFDRRIGVDELKGWLAGECEFPIAAVATISGIGPMQTVQPAPPPARAPEPAHDGPSGSPPPRRRRFRGRRPLAIGFAAGVLLVFGGIVAQAMSSPQPASSPGGNGSAQRQAVTTWSSPAPVTSQTPQRVALAPAAPAASPTSATGRTNSSTGALSAPQVSQTPAPAVNHGSNQPAATRPAPPSSPSPASSPSPSPSPTASAPPSEAASASDTSSSGGLVSGLLTLLIG